MEQHGGHGENRLGVPVALRWSLVVTTSSRRAEFELPFGCPLQQKIKVILIYTCWEDSCLSMS